MFREFAWLLLILVENITSRIHQASWATIKTKLHFAVRLSNSLSLSHILSLTPLLFLLLIWFGLLVGGGATPTAHYFLSVGYSTKSWNYCKTNMHFQEYFPSKISHGLSGGWNKKYFRFFETFKNYFLKKEFWKESSTRFFPSTLFLEDHRHRKENLISFLFSLDVLIRVI